MVEVGTAFRRLRMQLGNPSQEKMAADIGVKQGTVSKWLSGEVAITYQYAISISTRYKSLSFFLEWGHEEQQRGLAEYQRITA